MASNGTHQQEDVLSPELRESYEDAHCVQQFQREEAIRGIEADRGWPDEFDRLREERERSRQEAEEQQRAADEQLAETKGNLAATMGNVADALGESIRRREEDEEREAEEKREAFERAVQAERDRLAAA